LKASLSAAACACAGQQQQRQLNRCPVPWQITLDSSSESDACPESTRSGKEETDVEADSETDEIEELAGPALMQSLEHKMEHEERAIQELALFDKITHSVDSWKRAESHI
jgi:hypothetical protein